MPNIFLIIAIAIVAILLIFILLAGFVSASPGEIKVISGPRGQRVLHGKTGWKIPILERVDSMTAGMISVDVKTSDFVPTNDYINVKVDAAVKVKIGTENLNSLKLQQETSCTKHQKKLLTKSVIP